MNDQTCEPMPDLPGTPRPAESYGSFFLRAIWIIAGATILIVALFLTIRHTRLSQIGLQLFNVFVYSALIALPSIFLVTRVSVRYMARFPRLIVLIQAGVLICTSLAGSFAAGLVLLLIGITPPGGYWSEFAFSAPFCVFINLAIGLSMASFETLRYKLQAATLDLRTRQVEQERAYKLLAEARLSSLESRIHPHFLFNTLNSIAALIPSDPQRAEDTVGKLASLLRFSLAAHHGGLVTLAQELKIVRDYLEIEATRFGPRLRYVIDVPDTLADAKVPPLSLESLVENAVKHVVAQQPRGATIQIACSKEDGQLRLDVTDDGPGFSLDATTPEHGLGNLAARLELLFGPAGQLEVTRIDAATRVRILFPA